MSKRIAVITLLVLVGFIYFGTYDNALFWDDEDWIVNNSRIHEISSENIKFLATHSTLAGIGLIGNYYRPVLFFSFAINYLISDIQPFSYHLVNNLLHALNAIFIFLLLDRLFRNRAVAVIVAILFAIHPLNTEAVAYIAGRGDPLHYFFMLASILLFLSNRHVLSLAMLPLALLSHEKAIILPFLILLVGRNIKKSLPYFAITLVYGILRLTVLDFGNTLDFYETSNVYSESFFVRMFTFLPVVAKYIGLLVVPVGLHMERSVTVYTSLFQWPVWGIAIVLVGLLYWTYRSWRTDKSTVWLFGLGWFFIALGPVSGITPINAAMYEHWLYVPMLGPLTIVTWYGVKLFSFLMERFRILAVLVGVIVVVYGIAMGIQTVRRNALWGDALAFYEDVLRYEPESVRMLNNIGNIYSDKRGDDVQAEKYYLRAIAVGDVFAQPHYNLGTILEKRGDIYGALTEYEAAIKVDPRFTFAYQKLITILASQGKLSQALEYAKILVQLTPDDPQAQSALTTLLNAQP